MSEEQPKQIPQFNPTPFSEAVAKGLKAASKVVVHVVDQVMTQAADFERDAIVDYLRHHGATAMADGVERGEHLALKKARDEVKKAAAR